MASEKLANKIIGTGTGDIQLPTKNKEHKEQGPMLRSDQRDKKGIGEPHKGLLFKGTGHGEVSSCVLYKSAIYGTLSMSFNVRISL